MICANKFFVFKYYMRTRKNIRMKKSNRKHFKRTKSQRKIRSRRNYRGGSNVNRPSSPNANRQSNRTLSQNNTSLKTKLQGLIASNIQTLIPEFDTNFNTEILQSDNENGNDLLLLVKSGNQLTSTGKKNIFLCVFDKKNNFLVLYPQIFKNDDSDEIIRKRLDNIKNDLELYLKNEEMVLPLAPENESEFNEYKDKMGKKKDFGKTITQELFTDLSVDLNNTYNLQNNNKALIEKRKKGTKYDTQYDFFSRNGVLFLDRFFKYLLKKSRDDKKIKRKHKESNKKICAKRRKRNLPNNPSIEGQSINMENIILNIDVRKFNLHEDTFKEDMGDDLCKSDGYDASTISFPFIMQTEEGDIKTSSPKKIDFRGRFLKLEQDFIDEVNKIKENMETCADERYYLVSLSLSDEGADLTIRGKKLKEARETLNSLSDSDNKEKIEEAEKKLEKAQKEEKNLFKHANTLLFDLKNRRIIRIEPHGFNKVTLYDQNKMDCLVKKILYMTFLKDKSFTYVNESINMGEFDTFFTKEQSVQGNQEICYLVSSLISFLSILYPKYTIAALNKVLQKNKERLFIQFMYLFLKFLQEIKITLKKDDTAPETKNTYYCKLIPNPENENYNYDSESNSLTMNFYQLLRETQSSVDSGLKKICPLNDLIKLKILDFYINEDYIDFEYLYGLSPDGNKYVVKLNGKKKEDMNYSLLLDSQKVNITK